MRWLALLPLLFGCAGGMGEYITPDAVEVRVDHTRGGNYHGTTAGVSAWWYFGE